MPSGNRAMIPIVLENIVAANPHSLLDIGCGFGKFGVLAREYLELWDGRDNYHEWTRRIDAIEAHAPYITGIHKAVYTEIHVGNALEVLPTLGHYDFILAADILEHFTKDDGERFLDLCAEHGKQTFIVTPHNPSDQGPAFGNEYERHRSKWTPADFARFEFNASTAHPALIVMFRAKVDA